jgi:hypothetical protein
MPPSAPRPWLGKGAWAQPHMFWPRSPGQPEPLCARSAPFHRYVHGDRIAFSGCQLQDVDSHFMPCFQQTFLGAPTSGPAGFLSQKGEFFPLTILRTTTFVPCPLYLKTCDSLRMMSPSERPKDRMQMPDRMRQVFVVVSVGGSR